MVKIELFRIIKYLDKLLLSKESNIITYSITDIHFVKAHNLFIRRYNILNKNFFFLFFLANFSKNLFFFLNYIIIKVLQSLTYTKKIHEKKQVLFISHYVENKKENDNNDFYYSNIPYLLNKQKITNSIIYFKDKKYKKNFYINNPNDYFKYNLKIKKIISIFTSIVQESKRLIILYIKTKNLTHKKIILFCILNLFRISTFKNNIVKFEFEDLLKNISPSLVIITHEGHPYERLFFNIAKKLNIISIGYVTGVFLPLQHGNNRDLKIAYNPDYISYQSNLLKSLSNNKIKTKKIVLGNQFVYEKYKNFKKTKESFNVLVLPEGLFLEESFFILQIINFAKLNNNIKYYIRLHPLSDFKSIFKKLGIPKIPTNIILSKNKFNDDLNQCNFALYRGSTAIIHAVKNGLIPLYLNKPDEVSINPLFELRDEIIVINNFKNIQDLYNNNNFYNSYKLNHNKIINYCHNYFDNSNIKPIIDILN